MNEKSFPVPFRAIGRLTLPFNPQSKHDGRFSLWKNGPSAGVLTNCGWPVRYAG